jgi:hypothetical protein
MDYIHESQISQLALSASSAAMERMFSFSVHILTNKRRKKIPYLFKVT